MSLEFKTSKKFQHYLALYPMVEELAAITDGSTSIGMHDAFYCSFILIYLSMHGETPRGLIGSTFNLPNQRLSRITMVLGPGLNWKKNAHMSNYEKPGLGFVTSRENPDNRTEVLITLSPEGETFLRRFNK